MVVGNNYYCRAINKHLGQPKNKGKEVINIKQIVKNNQLIILK